MGYTTDFEGRLKFNKTLAEEDKSFLNKLASTRRMARDVDAKYGVEGEFYVEGEGTFGQDREDSVIDYNRPPRTQPSLWLQWVPSEDGNYLEWDGNEKFYNYVQWLEYLIENVFKPRGYSLDGEISWYGEESDDLGRIVVEDNQITILRGVVRYEKE